MKMQIPEIFDYIDFRKYLGDYRKQRSSWDPGFTHFYICHRLGMKNSRSYFDNIVKGRKNISTETVEKLIRILELKGNPASYFRILVNYGQTKNPEERAYYFDQLIDLNNTPRRIIDENTYEYFKEWYHPVIRELFETYRFAGNFSELASKLDPPISARNALESVKLLETLGLIRKNSEGFFETTDKVISTPDSIQNHIIQQYQLKSFDRAKLRVTNDHTKHKTSTLTISVSKEALKKIIEKMDQFRSAVRSISRKDESNERKVYEIIIHAHSQSK